ncbi:hypothetical protein [Amycolatopsis sp.]|uniref:hypothetical protein n=1 Tax=Amycolatopsis sp. TaxID=37632 RepID=UPI00260D3CDA|nr:hypothetical protein [Amycolatopsis sp.]
MLDPHSRPKLQLPALLEVLRRIPEKPRAKDLERAETYNAFRERLRHDRTALGVAQVDRTFDAGARR